MIEEEKRSRHPRWPIYVLSGCGVLLLMGIIAVVCVSVFVGSHINHVVQSTLNPKPIVRTSPYHFGYENEAAKVSIILPSNYGTLVYEHNFLDAKRGCGGERAILLTRNNSTKQEWPLPYYSLEKVKVGVYWYPAKGSQGPALRFYDATGESLLDFGCNEVGQIVRSGKQAFLSYYDYNNGEFSSGVSSQTSSNGSTKYYSADGSPARDITSVLTPDNCIYLGSIIRKGQKLVFVVNPNNVNHK